MIKVCGKIAETFINFQSYIYIYIRIYNDFILKWLWLEVIIRVKILHMYGDDLILKKYIKNTPIRVAGIILLFNFDDR